MDDVTAFLKTQVEQALAQGDALEDLVRRAHKLRQRRRVREADRVEHTLRAEYTFRQSENLQQALVFNVPKGWAFEAHRLSLFVDMRLISVQTGDGASEISFRPTVWTHAVMTNLAANNPGEAWPNPIDRLVDAQIELEVQLPDGSKGRSFQNAPFPVAHLFCGSDNSDIVGVQLVSSRPSALVFNVPNLIEPGTALLARVTPTFSGVRTTDSRLNEYRITGLLEGFKRIGEGA